MARNNAARREVVEGKNWARRLPRSLLKKLKMPHAKDTKGAKFSEKNPVGVFCDLRERLFQEAVRRGVLKGFTSRDGSEIAERPVMPDDLAEVI